MHDYSTATGSDDEQKRIGSFEVVSHLRVEVRARPIVTLGAPTLVARPSNLIARVGFDVSADGSRLLMVEEAGPEAQRAASVAVVQNWLAEFGQARNIGSRP